MPFYQSTRRRETEGGFIGALGKEERSTPGGFYTAIHKPKSSSPDLDSVDGLVKLARQKGLFSETEDVVEEDKLSFLQRLSYGLGALNPAEAIARQYEGTENFLIAYPKTVLQGIASSFTGNDYGEQTKRRFFGDLVRDLGVENKYARFGLGLVGDILLDPSTYVGGTIARGAIKGVGAAGRIGFRGLEKVAPETAIHLAQAGTSLKAAGGELFVFGYGASKATKSGEVTGLAEAYLEHEGARMNVKKALAVSNAKRYGTGVMTDTQYEEFLGYLFKGKIAEFNHFDTVTDELIENFNKKFPDLKTVFKGSEALKKDLSEKLGREATDIEVRSAIRSHTVNRIENLSQALPEKIDKLQQLRNKLAQPFIEKDLMGLKSAVSIARGELAELLPKKTVQKIKGKPFMATGEEIDSALMNALSLEKEKYTKMLLNLEAKINGIESGIIKPAEKLLTKTIQSKGARFSTEDILAIVMRQLDPKLVIKDKIVELDQAILQTTNEFLGKSRMLDSILAGKQIAKERITKAFKTGDFSTLPEELASALRPVVDDPTIKQALTERLTRNAAVVKQAGIEDPFVMYAPSVAKDVTERQRIMDYLSGTRSVKQGSKDYTKEFRNLLKEEELLKDRNLFLRVEDEVAANTLNNSFLEKVIEDYGEPLTKFISEREAKVAGYRLLKDKGIFGKEIGYVKEADWKFLNSQMSSTFGALDAIAKASGFDAATSLFKRFVTGPFAPFHIRNLASGELQNFELIGRVAQNPKVQATGIRIATKMSQGVFSEVADPFDAISMVGKKIKDFGEEVVELHGKPWKLNDISQAIEKRFGGSTRYNVDFNQITHDADALISTQDFSRETVKEWAKSFRTFKLSKNPVEGLVGENNPIFRGARVIGSWIEMQQKSKLVVGALEKGHSLDEALQIATKGGFNYRALTQFESRVMRRIIPFYSFNRFNVELQLKVLKENPQRINQIIRSIENAQNLWETNLTPEEEKNLPSYLKEYLSVPVGRTREGVPTFVRSFGTPIEAFTELIKFKSEGKSTIERTFLATLSKVNPYLKVPIELGIGKDSFRQRDLKEVYNAREFEIAPQFIKDWLKINKVTKKDFGTDRLRTIYVADPERLLVARSLFTSRGFTYFNNIFNGDVQGFFRILDLVSGIRATEVDVERQAGFNDRRLKEELGDVLRRNGVLSEFNKLFIPKEK